MPEAGAPEPAASSSGRDPVRGPETLGLYVRATPPRPGPRPLLWAAAAAGLAWVLFVLWLARGGAPGGTGAMPLITLLAAVLPVVLAGGVALVMARLADLGAETDRLRASVDALRQAYLAQAQAQGSGARSTVEAKLDEIARVSRKTQTTLAMFTSIRQAAEPQPAPSAPPPPEGEQPGLALVPPPPPPPQALSVTDFVRALNFPENAEDREGFAALRRALADRRVAQIVQASQDVLTLLSQDGIYMDDLTPDRARPELWRRFAKGERGRAVADLGGIRDRTSLALTTARMRADTIFRDAVHHFLRKFDQTLADFEPHATDQDMADLAETRTARAFMLLGRATGVFD
jgi:hypothetical protein